MKILVPFRANIDDTNIFWRGSSCMTESLRRSSLLRVAFVFAFAAVSPGRADETSVCRELEIKLDLITPQITSVETNQTLFASADQGCGELARRLLGDGASLEARDRFGTMPLAHAARAGHTALVELFLQKGAAVNARNLAGSTALYAAAENQHADVINLLLRGGADPNLPGRSGVTPLAAAAFQGNDTIVELLLARGADPTVRDSTGKTAMTYAAARGFHTVVARLLDANVPPDARYGNDLTALMWAAGHAEGVDPAAADAVIRLLLDRGAAIDAADNRGRTALMIAAGLGDAATVGALLKWGADPARRDHQGKTAFDLATSEPARAALSAPH
jgi:ankyrin repeat protein